MAIMHGTAGEWARVKGMVVGLWPLGLGIFLGGFAIATWVVAGYAWGSIMLAFSLALIGIALYWGKIRTENFYIGARGEERVSSILRNLPDRYHVFNDFVARGVHVDHVVVGPPGVFAIETKFWNGVVTVEGSEILLNGLPPTRSPLRQVAREAALVKDELARLGWSGDVTPVLTFASDTFAARIAEIQGTVILNSSDLSAGFSTERTVIPSAELNRLVSIMENNS